MTRDETALLIEVLVEAFKPSRMGTVDGQLSAYHMALDDVPYDLGKLAVRQIIRERTEFGMPFPGSVRQAALEIAIPMEPSEEAWQLVLKEVRRVGTRGAWHFDNPAITAAVKGVGWEYICTSERPELVAKEFKAAYDTARVRSLSEATPELVWTPERVALRG